jgi:hypothetical protein
MRFPEIKIDHKTWIYILISKNVSSLESNSIDWCVKLLTRLGSYLRIGSMIFPIKTTWLFFAEPIKDHYAPFTTTHIGITTGMPVSLEVSNAHTISNFELGPTANRLNRSHHLRIITTGSK